MAYVNEDVEFLARRLTDAIRVSGDPVSRLGLTADVRAILDKHLGDVEHRAIIDAYQTIGYTRLRQHVHHRRIDAALEREERMDPTFKRRDGSPRAKAHQP
jgi:hypothetical protein